MKLKLLRFVAPKIGQKLRGRVIAILERGIFVELLGDHVEGFLPSDELGRDEFRPSKDGFSLVAERTGKRIRLGDEMTVRLVGIDLTRRQLDLAPG